MRFALSLRGFRNSARNITEILYGVKRRLWGAPFFCSHYPKSFKICSLLCVAMFYLRTTRCVAMFYLRTARCVASLWGAPFLMGFFKSLDSLTQYMFCVFHVYIECTKPTTTHPLGRSALSALFVLF